MAYKKTAHRRRGVRSSRRKNAKSRKMRGGGKFTSIPQCNAAINSNPQLKKTLMDKTRNYTNPCPVIINNGGNY